MRIRKTGALAALIAFIALTASLPPVLEAQELATEKAGENWRFVSAPDFFNFDVPNPQPKWDSAIDYFLESVKAENPAFFLVAGDLVNGHWWDSPEQLEHLGNVYYGGWVRRMQDHNLQYYVCIGDHEVGDNPWPPEKIALVPNFKRSFAEHLQMPDTGPDDWDGHTWYTVHNNLLLIAVDTFEVRDGVMHHTVSGPQLAWLEQTLEDHADVPHKVIMGHCPVIPGNRSRSSSRLLVEGGREAELWQAMREHDVDMYLCGEFHDITTKYVDDVWQIVHGSSWGRVPDLTYLLVDFSSDDALHLTLKKIPLTLKGGAIWNINKPNGPREIVEISDEARAAGWETVGTVTIDKSNGERKNVDPTGLFVEGVNVVLDQP